MRLMAAFVSMLSKKDDIYGGGYLSWFLSNQKNVTDVKVYERTADAVICYVGDREEVLNLLKEFSYENAKLPEHVAAGSGRN